jgi:hypothetical protein
MRMYRYGPNAEGSVLGSLKDLSFVHEICVGVTCFIAVGDRAFSVRVF